MKTDHKTEVSNLSASHERKIESLKNDHVQDKRQAIDNLSTDHKAELKKLKDEHEQAIKRLNSSFEQQTAQTEMANAANLKKLLQDH